MNLRTLSTAAGLLAGMVCLADSAWAQGPPALAGYILGQVKNTAGIVQMGAMVVLYNRYDQVVRQGLSNESGRFLFDALVPDLYWVRVTLASFIPAERRNISVAASSQSRLEISLSGALGSVEFSPSTAQRG